ncbi:ABC transporter substrate-binding protein [Nocardioides sp. Kera G14]|uniref:ABC transporter substrate-binding protein n=1 Tax=Nocardioides sp. Kera G14 TaxID=2884264 RepID=UPI001D116216|nr:extracellular solute-binding protein [Nocardioides sp. Kera G14]UDY24948.1 extracellular solute-binding protein [Nocardioides sp. Kera G14]
MKKFRTAALAAMCVGALFTASACGSSDDSSAEGGKTTLTLWTNSTTGPGVQYFKDAAAAYHTAHPDVTIKVQSVQNEDLDGKLQSALQAGKGTAPDLFLQRGGGKLQAMVNAHQVLDITDSISDDAKAKIAEGTWNTENVDDKTYAMPVSITPGGFWYSKDVFQKAGITTPPTTIAEMQDADKKLSASGVAPIALGGKDAWPAAHWYFWFALRDCSQQTLNDTAKSLKFDDDCWTKAGEDLEAFAATKPFQEGFLNTPAQQGASSSAGLVANHKAGSELMGAWDPGVIASLTPDQKPLADLGFFPFPATDGGEGDPAAIMGGADGYSCSAWAPKAECTDFLNFLATADQQKAYAEAFNAIPVNQDAQTAVTDPSLKAAMDAANNAPYVSLWLDTLYGQNVGNALNGAVVDLLAGKGSPEDIIKTVDQAAAKG